MEPFREVFWNISNPALFYALAAFAAAVFFYGLYKRYRLWTGGWKERSRRELSVGAVLGRIAANTSIFSGDILGGITHMAIMWGFVLLFIGTAMSTTDHWIFPYLSGKLYLAYAFVLDIAGAVLILGIVLAYARRFVFKSDRMVTVVRDHAVLLLLLFITVSGFIVEGLRLAANPPPWTEPSPVGRWIANSLDMNVSDALLAHKVWWWLHALASLFLVAWFPFSKYIHLLAAPANLLFESTNPIGFLSIEEREALLSDFSIRQRIMMDACTQCNRCTVVCPSAIAGEGLSPRRAVNEAGTFVRRKYAFGLFPGKGVDLPRSSALTGEELWYCTTCSHCYKECPNGVSPMEILHEVRAARIEGAQDVPENLQVMLESVYKFKNPWQGAKGKRMDWASNLSVPIFSEGAKSNRCFYVGCTFAYDSRLQEVPRAAVSVFEAAGYSYAILGKEEVCCSEFVRGAGEEGLFFELASQNLDLFDKYGVEEIVTPCPHGRYTLDNEYRLMNEQAVQRNVLHLSQVLEKLIKDGAVKLENRGEMTVTYHDPCFLARRSGIYDAPREVIRSIPGVRLVEMKRNRERSLCCGGGGGRMWVDAAQGEKIAEIRVKEAAETGAETIITACPFCLTNLDDAVKTVGYENKVTVKDLAEVVAEHLSAGKGK